MSERKVPYNVNFTARQVKALNVEAKRLGVPFADAVRRIVDGWIDREPQKEPGLRGMYGSKAP